MKFQGLALAVALGATLPGNSHQQPDTDSLPADATSLELQNNLRNIVYLGEAESSVGANGSDIIMKFGLMNHDGKFPVKFYSYDSCNNLPRGGTPIDALVISDIPFDVVSSVQSGSPDYMNTLEARLNLKEGLNNFPIWAGNTVDGVDELSFCLRVDNMAPNDEDGDTSVAFSLVQVKITVNMTEGFANAEYDMREPPTPPPSVGPSGTPSVQPSKHPSPSPSERPSRTPSVQPSERPSVDPSPSPSDSPSSLRPTTAFWNIEYLRHVQLGDFVTLEFLEYGVNNDNVSVKFYSYDSCPAIAAGPEEYSTELSCFTDVHFEHGDGVPNTLEVTVDLLKNLFSGSPCHDNVMEEKLSFCMFGGSATGEFSLFQVQIDMNPIPSPPIVEKLV